DSDVDDLVIATRPGVELTGRIVFMPAPPSVRPDLQVSSKTQQRRRSFRASRPVKVQEDLSFVFHDLVGPAILRPDRLPQGWWLKNVLLGAEDITDVPTEFKGRDSG